MIEYKPPSFDSTAITPKPPVWITMIGQNGDPVPLQYFTHLDDDANCYVWPGEENSQMKFPHTTLPMIMFLLSLFGFVAYFTFRFFRSPLFFWKANNLSGWKYCEAFIYRFFCLASLIILLLPFVALYWLADLGIANTDIWDKTQKILLRGAQFLVTALAIISFTPVMGLLLPTWRKTPNPQPPGQSAPCRWRFCLEWGLYLLAFLDYVLLVGALAAHFIHRCHSQYASDHLTSWQAMLLERALNLTTGVSPLLPLIFVCLTLFLWFVYQLRRLHLADQFSVANPFPEKSAGGYPFQEITELNDALQGESRSSLTFVKHHWGWITLVSVIVILGAVRLYSLFLPTAEGTFCTLLFFCTFALGFFLVTANLLRFWLLWRQVKQLLGNIALLPMARAFSQLPVKVRTLFGSTLLLGLAHSRAHKSTMRLSYHLVKLLQVETEHLLQGNFFAHRSQVEDIKSKLDSHKFDAQKDFDDSPPSVSAQGTRSDPGYKLAKLTKELLDVLTNFWPEHSVKDAFGDGESVPEDQAESHHGDAGNKKGKPYRRWVELAEDVIAVWVVIYLSQFFLQMRNLIWPMLVCGTLLLLGNTSYPFQPERWLFTLLLSLLGAVLAGIVSVLVQMNRDELLSRIARTPPNRFKLDWDFVSSVLLYVVPLGTVIVLRMSGAFRFLLEPLVRALR